MIGLTSQQTHNDENGEFYDYVDTHLTDTSALKKGPADTFNRTTPLATVADSVETLKRVDFLTISEIFTAPETNNTNANDPVKSSLSGWKDQESPLNRGANPTQLKL